jgi:hypothetical protein
VARLFVFVWSTFRLLLLLLDVFSDPLKLLLLDALLVTSEDVVAVRDTLGSRE